MKFISFFISILISTSAVAALSIPKNLNASDRRKALEILGLSSSAKILGNPYPLGGFSGVEIGLTAEVLATGELSVLGDKSESQKETSYSLLSLGKGLYHNVDIFLQFAPFQQGEDISNFGGQLRWGFYQADYLPAHLSVIAFGNSTNFKNQVVTVSSGADLIVGFSVQDMTLYTGIGFARATGTFMGGTNGVTAPDIDSSTGLPLTTRDTKSEEVSASHYVAGINVKFAKMFFAMQLDRYTQATYSAKLGARF
ncbi:MAG: hypothetical protein ACXWC9_05950 [Pseudobdellovibrionaceae bacterium]